VLSFCETTDHARARTGLSAPSGAGFTAELIRPEGATSYRDQMIAEGQYLEIPDGSKITIRPYNPYRAKMFIPCTYGRCPGRMQLRVAYQDNTPIERPYYLCEGKQWQCPNSQVPVYPEDIRTDYVASAHRAKKGRLSNERVYEHEMETML